MPTRYVPLNVPRMVAHYQARAGEAVEVVAHRVLERAIAEAPERTGALKRSGHVLPGPDPTIAYVIFDVVSERGFGYSAVVHNGGGHNSPNPFLARAVMLEKDAAFQTFQQTVKA